MEFDKRKAGAVAAAVLAAALVFAAVQEQSGRDRKTASTGSYWNTTVLEDVNSGESYTISDLEKPVLVETFAVWCSTCTAQQQQVADLKSSGSEVTSVSLNTDPNEDASRVRDHTDRHGFGWRYSVAPPEVTSSLAERFGSSMLNPPSAPMVLVCEEGTRRLRDGIKTSSDLEEQIDRGC